MTTAEHPRHADLPRLREKSREALAVLEGYLAKRPFHVSAWLDRVRAQPGFVAQ